MEKKASEIPSDERTQELRELGFVTALQTAGVDENKIGDLYDLYKEQDAARSQNLQQAYNTIIGKSE